jgi:hypothetical protein
LPTPPQPPPEHHDKPTDVERSRAWLEGFDTAQDLIDKRLERTEQAPEDIVIADIRGRRLVVSTSPGGVVQVRGFHAKTPDRDVTRLAQELGKAESQVRDLLDQLNGEGHTVAWLDRDNAHALSDALQWAARVSV